MNVSPDNDILQFASSQSGDMDVRFVIDPADNPQHDGYRIKKLDNTPTWQITGNNARSCLWAVYHIQATGTAGSDRGMVIDACDGTRPRTASIYSNAVTPPGTEGVFTPRFDIRGLNICESLARHDAEQIRSYIDRIGRWRMNTLIIHPQYGYEGLHKGLIEDECRLRGIDIVYYIQTSLQFLRNTPVECFARDAEGKLYNDTLVNETRLCVSHPDSAAHFRKGAKDYFTNRSPAPGSRMLFMDADGYSFCQCSQCRHIPPHEQWMRLFPICIEQAKACGKNFELEYLSYVWRYRLPQDFAVFDDVSAVLFDTHQRFRWQAIHKDHPMTMLSEQEGKADPLAKTMPLNTYLHMRLQEWRKAFDKRIYIFENLMLQGSISCPQPYTPQLLEDLDEYQRLNIQGVVYEAFEPGIQSFTDQLDTLSNALWEPVPVGRCCANSIDDPPPSEPQAQAPRKASKGRPTEHGAQATRPDARDSDPHGRVYTPTALENACATLAEPDNKTFNYKYNFQVLIYLTTDRFDGLALLAEHINDPLLLEYASRLRTFFMDSTFDNARHIIRYVLDHRERFDWMLIGFNLLRQIPRRQLPVSNHPDAETLLATDKLWDYMEHHSGRIATNNTGDTTPSKPQAQATRPGNRGSDGHAPAVPGSNPQQNVLDILESYL